MQLPITAATAAVLTLLLVGLAYDTVRHRLRTRTGFGLGTDDRLTRASRAHGNLAEHAPFAIILIGLLENSGANTTALTVFAAIFVAGRFSHASGLYTVTEDAPPPTRVAGVAMTWLSLLGLAGWTFWELAR